MGIARGYFSEGLYEKCKLLHTDLDTCPIIRLRKESSLRGSPMRNIGDEPMKRAIRISVLMVGLVGTFIAAAVQQVPAADGGPLLLCPPRQPHCSTSLRVK